MRSSLPLLLPIIGTATILLAGCAGGDRSAPADPSSSSVLPQAGIAHPAWWREAPATARVGVYVAQADGSNDGVVFGYRARNRRNRAPVCSIIGQKFVDTEIAADAYGDLYVPNIETAGVFKFARNCVLIGGFTDPYGPDIDVAAGASRIYAVGSDHVAVCGRQGCTRKLTEPSIRQLQTAAVDSKGNVWGSYYSQEGLISLIVWPGGAMPGRTVSGYVNQNTPGGLLFDKAGTLISVQTRFTHVYTYRCDAARARCKNTGTFNLHGGSLFGALNAKNTDFQVTDYSNDSVDVYAYPSFAYEYSYDQGLMKGYSVEGIAQTR